MTDHLRDDYRDGPDGAPVLGHDDQASRLVRRIVADPDDESAWRAYAADLADHGHDAEALIVRVLWPALRDSLLTLRSFDAVMSDVRRNRNVLRALAAREATDPDEPRSRDGPGPARRWSKGKAVLFGLTVAASVIGMGFVVLKIVLGPK
ncbi:MAG TPA: hypothetical protein VKD90_14665 [Gemmataceae bacterium]|nr:hypothetical protein [Gemmataceae bacterium]